MATQCNHCKVSLESEGQDPNAWNRNLVIPVKDGKPRILDTCKSCGDDLNAIVVAFLESNIPGDAVLNFITKPST